MTDANPTSTGLQGLGTQYDGVWTPATGDSGTSTVEVPMPLSRLARWRSTLRALLHRRLHLGHCSMRMSVGTQFITLSVDGQDYRFDRQSGDYMP